MTALNPIHLTPTARLARNLARELAAGMTAAGQTAWLPPDIFSFPAWTARLRDDYFLGSDDPRVAIDAQQALVLWQSLIDTQVFIGEPQVAELAQRSWRLVHDHALDAPATWPALLLSEDSARFKQWAAAYQSACTERGLVDEWVFAAEIPGLLIQGAIEAPATVELVGFDLPATPLQVKILAALETAGASVQRSVASTRPTAELEVVEFEEPDHELLGAARWARDLLEANPQQSIAVVVPDLGGRVDRVDRVFRQVFDPPAATLQGPGPEPWHISLGEALAQWPLVTDAIAILSMANHRFSQPRAARLLRSPFLSGWLEQGGARNQTLARLAMSAPYDVTASELQFALERNGDQVLAERLASWQDVRRDAAGPAWPSQWVGHFQQELSNLGFAAGRPLDSREFQVLQRWHDLLEACSSLDVVCSGPVSRQQALMMLTQRANVAVFRERNAGVPVEVLGVEEALGSQFDALWVTTLDDVTWPGAPQRDPLIPAAVQAEVPRATSDGSLHQAQLELEGLLGAARISRGSFARGSDETPIAVTALLSDCLPTVADPILAVVPADMAVPISDAQAPALEGVKARGGTGALRDQSGCPFRAFALRRLNAIDLTPPRPGLDAAGRGTVVHKALEKFWDSLDGHADLVAMTAQACAERVALAVHAALDDLTSRFRLALSTAGRALEQQRTERVLLRWLALEEQREPFSVIEHEHDIALDLAGVRFTGSIDRLDLLADDAVLLIDYKTGRTSKGDWFPEPRIVDPQLPAYAVSIEPKPGAIAFARIRPEDLRFEGLADGVSGTPGVGELAAERYRFKELDSWDELLDDWHIHIEALAEDFRDGMAAVDPRAAGVCGYCHLQALCRISERTPFDE
jgi:ATP-dependent helicase/nuclease subunit B